MNLSSLLLPTNSYKYEDIIDIVSRIGNLCYEIFFIIDFEHEGLSSLSTPEKFADNVLTAKPLLQSNYKESSGLYADEIEKLTIISEAIQHYFSLCNRRSRSSLLFLTDILIQFNGIRQNRTLKLIPLSETPGGHLRQMIGAITLSSGTFNSSLIVINQQTSERKAYDYTSSSWQTLELPSLSPIEKSVLALSAQGLSVPEISQITYRAQDSVKSIRKRIFEKLGVKNITEAITFAINYQIL